MVDYLFYFSLHSFWCELRMDSRLKGLILNCTLKSYTITPIESNNVLEVTMKFCGDYKYKSPSKRRRDRLRKERFLAKFKRDPLLVPIPFLEPGHSPSPVALGGPVCSAIATAFMTQAEEMLQNMKDLCHQQDCLAQETGKAEKEWEKMCLQVWDLRSVVRGELESLEQELQIRKMSWHSLRPEKKCWRPLVLHLEYQSGLQGCPWVLQLSQVHPKRKRKRNKKTPWPALTRRAGVL